MLVGVVSEFIVFSLRPREPGVLCAKVPLVAQCRVNDPCPFIIYSDSDPHQNALKEADCGILLPSSYSGNLREAFIFLNQHPLHFAMPLVHSTAKWTVQKNPPVMIWI